MGEACDAPKYRRAMRAPADNKRKAEGSRPADVRRRTEGSATHVNKAGQYPASDGRHERQTEGVGTRPSPTARAALWQSAPLASSSGAKL